MSHMLDDRTKALIRALLYLVQFEQRPEEGIARVMEQVVQRGALQATPADYHAAIGRALNSTELLSRLLPRSQDEETVRRYLNQLRLVLESKPTRNKSLIERILGAGLALFSRSWGQRVSRIPGERARGG